MKEKIHIAKRNGKEHIEMYCGRVCVTFHNDIKKATCRRCIQNYKASPTKIRYVTNNR